MPRRRRAAPATRASRDQVAPHLAGVDLAPGHVHVRHRDQLALARRAATSTWRARRRRRGAAGRAAARSDRESATQYSLKSSPVSRVVGDDRTVRVEQVRVAALAAGAVDRDEAELRVHRVLRRRDDRAQKLARPHLGAALAARVVRRRRRVGRSALAGAVPAGRQAPARSRRRSARRERPARWRARASTAGGRREEHDPLGVPRDLGEVAHHGRLAPLRPRRSGPRPTSRGRAGGETPRPGAPRPRRPRGRPRPAARRRARASCAPASRPGLCQRPSRAAVVSGGPRPRGGPPRERRRPPGRPRRRARAGRCRPPRRRSRAPTAPRRPARCRGRGRPRAPRNACIPTRARPRRRTAGPRCAAFRTPSKSTSAPSSVWPPVTITASGPSAGDRLRELLRAGALAQAGELPRLGEVGRDDGGAAAGPARSAPPSRSGRAARRRSATTITGSTTTGASPTRSSASTTASIVGSSPSIPTLTASTPMSRGHRPHLGDDHLRRHRRDHLDAHRVLRGERRDRGRPVHAAARERLQVGLDPRAAAGVRAGDREAGAGSARLASRIQP